MIFIPTQLFRPILLIQANQKILIETHLFFHKILLYFINDSKVWNSFSMIIYRFAYLVEDEIKSLYMQENFDDAASAVSQHVEIAALTRGPNGAIIRIGEQNIQIDAASVDQVIDTTGAGDQFAAGFLYGFTEGKAPEICGKLGALAAAEVISHMGPRPEATYKELIEKAA